MNYREKLDRCYAYASLSSNLQELCRDALTLSKGGVVPPDSRLAALRDMCGAVVSSGALPLALNIVSELAMEKVADL